MRLIVSLVFGVLFLGLMWALYEIKVILVLLWLVNASLSRSSLRLVLSTAGMGLLVLLTVVGIRHPTTIPTGLSLLVIAGNNPSWCRSTSRRRSICTDESTEKLAVTTPPAFRTSRSAIAAAWSRRRRKPSASPRSTKPCVRATKSASAGSKPT